jgi:transposase
MSDKHLEDVAEASERVRRARRDYYAAQMRLRKSVVRARKSHSLRRIAEMAGVSNVTILNWSRDGDSG